MVKADKGWTYILEPSITTAFGLWQSRSKIKETGWLDFRGGGNEKGLYRSGTALPKSVVTD